MIYAIEGMTCEHVENPINLAVFCPRFGWKLVSERSNIRQTAYQLQVFDEEGREVWDSGVIHSQNTREIGYRGEVLQSLSSYSCKITSWGNNEWMAENTLYFETGFMDAGDWKASWIEPSEPLPQLAENPLFRMRNKWEECVRSMMRGEQVEILTDWDNAHGEDLEPYDPALLFCKKFLIKKPVKKAKIFASAHGIYQIRMNGRKISTALLTPGFTTYDKRIKYQAYDVTDYVKEGNNGLGITVADGWYKGKIALGRGCEYGEVPGLLLQLEIWYQDGSRESICSDGSFCWSFDGEVRMADLFTGQKNDGRMKIDASSPDLDVSLWPDAAVREKPDAVLCGQIEPFVEIFDRIPAQNILRTPKGELVVDFGQNLAGYIRVELTGNGESGEEIIFEHGEVLDQEGNFTYTYTGSTQEQTDHYICAGEEAEVFEPEFTYHGFRYVKVTGGRDWTKVQFTAMAISSRNPVTGRFCCSDEALNQLQHNIYWSQRSNNITIPTDCPTREKAGWTGDVLIYGPTALYNQDMRSFYEDWLCSIRAEQREDGHILHTVPQIKNYVQQAGAGSIGWGDVILMLPWQLYLLWGDKKPLEDNYENMKRWMDAMIRGTEELPPECQKTAGEAEASPEEKRHLENQKYLVNTGFHFGDWLVPSVKNEQGAADGALSAYYTMKYVDTAILAGMSELLAQISKVIGKSDSDAVYYQNYADRVREAFFEELCDEKGKLGQDMQGNYILALKYKMVPEEMESKLAARLNRLIVENAYIMDAGFMSVAHFLDVLVEYGYEETAWKVLWQKKCPSWLYEVEQGATTMWESWDAVKEDGKAQWCSFNHYAFGCVGDFIYRRILGLNASAIGYDRIRIAPAYHCGLDWAEGSFDSVNGLIAVRWEKGEEAYRLTVTIPVNTMAELVLEDGTVREVGSGTYLIKCNTSVECNTKTG